MPPQNLMVKGHEPVTPGTRLWSWRKSSISTDTSHVADVSRLPITSAWTSAKLKFGSRTVAWSGRRTQSWKWKEDYNNVYTASAWNKGSVKLYWNNKLFKIDFLLTTVDVFHLSIISCCYVNMSIFSILLIVLSLQSAYLNNVWA